MSVATEPSLPRLKTARQVAAATGLSTARVYELTRLGLIPHVRIGRSVRFSAAAIREWLAAGGTGYDDGPSHER